MHSWFRSRRHFSGFTLVELVVVVLVLGILAAAAIPRMFGTTQAANLSATMRDYQVIADAASHYRAANGEWPGLTHAKLAPGDFDGYLDARVFLKSPPIGSSTSRWIWNRDVKGFAAVLYFRDTSRSLEIWQELDDQFDDGDLDAGAIRRSGANVLVFIVREEEDSGPAGSGDLDFAS